MKAQVIPEIQDKLMADLLQNQIRIVEVYTDKPNLENVFIDLINRPVQKSSLSDLLDEIVPETADTDETDTKEED